MPEPTDMLDQLDPLPSPSPEADYTVEDTEDGGAIITMTNQVDEQEHAQHFANIVEELDQTELQRVVVTLLDLLEEDKISREDRDKLYEEGLRRTGLGDDAPGGATFQGANKTVHPLLAEACVDFAARAMKEIFPPGGPVKSKVLGLKDREKIDKAQRKTEFMNWQCTEQISELRTDIEKLLGQLPLGGGQYLKLMHNNQKRRPVAEFVPIDDILLPYAASNFYSSDRKTHVQRITEEEFQERVDAGMYIDIPLPAPPPPEETKAAQANAKIEGKERDPYNVDGRRIVYEVMVTIELEDHGLCPYIISIDDQTQQAVAVYRNWEKDDPDYEELQWIVEFSFVPWRGAYPIGLTHLIGGLSGSATGALRALLDSAHVQNIPTLLKLKSAMKGEDVKLGALTMTEIEAGMTDDIRKLVMPVPFNQPSPTLFQLLGFLVDAGKSVVRTSFENISELRGDAPVGTTMALIEQGLVVFNAIHSRLHQSMAVMLKILHRLNSAYLTTEGVKSYGGEPVRPEDFDGPLDVIPVSDPQIFSDMQRFAQIQAVMQRADAKPQLYDQRVVEEVFLRQLKFTDEVLVKKEDPENMDPASENASMTMGGQAYVLPKQDHISHLRVHMEYTQSQILGGNPVMVQTLLVPMITHLRNHIVQYYLQESHKAVQLAIENNLIKEDDAMGQAMIIVMVQKEIDELLAPAAQLLGQLAQTAQAMQPKPPQDKSLEVAGINAQARVAVAEANKETQHQRLQLDAQKAGQEEERKRLELSLEERYKTQQLELEKHGKLLDERALELEKMALTLKEELEVLRQDREDRRQAGSDATRLQMNQEDNRTAKELAALEVATGENIAVSTGTGINPNP